MIEYSWTRNPLHQVNALFSHFRVRLALPAAALVAALVLSACGGDSDQSPTPLAQTQASQASQATASQVNPAPEVVAPETPLEAPSEVPEELMAIWEAWEFLRREHVDRSELDPAALTEAAIIGMLRTLEDQGTYYVGPEVFRIESEALQGNFEGIGAHVQMRLDGKLIIVAPLEGSPAMAAGIKAGDLVLEVDGKSIEGMSLLEAVGIIRGPRGSKVALLVKHLGQLDPVEIVVTRGVIPLVSVLLRSEPGDKVAHIRLTDFYADTTQRLIEAIREARATGAEGLIIDVRNNPGGLLSAAIDVTSQFLEDGLVTYEMDGGGNRTNWKVRTGGVATDIPLVILTNQFSASASEILAGAIQDHQRGTIVGTSTFGKGSVNILRRLSNEGAVSITIARWFSPLGRLIEGDGLSPDIEVTHSDPQQADTLQLEKAIEVLEAAIEAAAADGGTGAS